MSKRCRSILYSILGCIALLVMAVLIKVLCFSGLFVPLLKLQGDKMMEVEVNTRFKDPGVKARYHLSEYHDEIKITSNLNMHKLGTYKIMYEAKKYQKSVTRNVHVIDTIPPKITLKKEGTLRIFVNEKYVDPGFIAQDNYDGDISAKVRIDKQKINTHKIGTYHVVYYVSDASGNETIKKRKVQVCADPTTTKLYYNHDSYNNTMEEWWFHKSENHERMSGGGMDEKSLLNYNAYYIGADEKVMYLTFDEGGNDITYIKEIAEVLKQNDVQATYFLTRNYIKDNPAFMRKLVKEGNVIGNHTWHHYDMTTLANARSVDKFVSEISETEKTYMEVTGQPMKKVFRFPKGGSSERAMKMVQDLGYSTYNWSHAYYDFANDVSKEEALKTLMDHYHNGAIYLLHPSNKGNYEAMDSFIKQMKDLGYSFKTVDTIPREKQE